MTHESEVLALIQRVRRSSKFNGMPLLSHETAEIIKKLNKLLDAEDVLQQCHTTLTHALDLDYLGGGSTRGMAVDAVREIEKSIKVVMPWENREAKSE